MMAAAMTRWRERRLRRAQEELADAQHHFDTWIEPFDRRLGTVEPSRMAREQRKLEKLRARVRHLGGEA
jgi:hypothetical protein